MKMVFYHKIPLIIRILMGVIFVALFFASFCFIGFFLDLALSPKSFFNRRILSHLLNKKKVMFVKTVKGDKVFFTSAEYGFTIEVRNSDYKFYVVMDGWQDGCVIDGSTSSAVEESFTIDMMRRLNNYPYVETKE